MIRRHLTVTSDNDERATNSAQPAVKVQSCSLHQLSIAGAGFILLADQCGDSGRASSYRQMAERIATSLTQKKRE